VTEGKKKQLKSLWLGYVFICWLVGRNVCN